MIIRDQLQRTITLDSIPKRIVSCVPSITELLFEFVPANSIVGRTKFCIHPKDQIVDIPKIGGTKTLNLDMIKNLNPDLIIANKEENVKLQIETLASSIPTYVSDVPDLKSTCKLIEDMGKMFSKDKLAESMVLEIARELDMPPNAPDLSALYLIWKEPYMSIGSDTYIHDVLINSGFTNAINHKKRYPVVTIDEINKLKPSLILLSSEPFPFAQKHIDELYKNLEYPCNIILVDGELFSWYGVKSINGLKYARKLRSTIF